MAKLKLRGRDLKKIGFSSGKISARIIDIMHVHFKHSVKDEVLALLKKIIKEPASYLSDPILQPIAELLIEHPAKEMLEEIPLNEGPLTYPAYGLEGIADNAVAQMDVAMRLPVSVGGALMADAHHGYGLPIGGVLATKNSIIPYGVGVDIGCRMSLSIYDLPDTYLEQESYVLKKYIVEHSRFGRKEFDDPMDDPVLERKEFQEIPMLNRLKNKAYHQIGSSGGGNHFVEFGIVDIPELDEQLNVPAGRYLGLLSHSGSRGLGANISNFYTKVAMQQCLLPKAAQHLAWLDMDSEAGMEYWLAMNLAGDYASACHRHIHLRMSRALGCTPIAKVENHHNFAWKEKDAEGNEVMVHRKGATPAGKDVLGIIPGSMTASGFIVKGKGNTASFNSASHGAGRLMSRTKAKNSLTHNYVKKYLRQKGVHLIGGGLDEAPMAYKNIDEVMNAQRNLVDVVGSFLPKIVRMAKD